MVAPSRRRAATTKTPRAPRQVKVLMLGNTCVGKTSLVHRFSEDMFGQASPTIGIESQTRIVSVNGEDVKVHVFTSTGLERFQVTSFRYYPLAAGVALTYSVTDRASFEDVRTWAQRLQEYGDGQACHMLLANKADLESDRVVSTDEGRALAREMGLSFFETSAVTGQNMDAAFLEMAITAELRMEEIRSLPPSGGHAAEAPRPNTHRHSFL